MVILKNLHKTYNKNGTKVEALKGINLTIDKSDIYGIIGLSGAGKSSLVRCINLLEKPEIGEVIVEGTDLTKVSKNNLRKARKQIGMIFQHFNLLMNSTVFENIAFPLRLEKKSKEYIDQKVNEMLELVGLVDKRDMYPAMLSGGQKQRVGIARALVGNPSVLMCDEATSALDPVTTKSILELLKDINKKLNITIIIITHEMEVIKQVCNKVAILENGEIIEHGKVLEIATKPKTKTAMEFFEYSKADIVNYLLENCVDLKGSIIRAIFIGEIVNYPLISNIVSKYNVETSILLGNIQKMNETLIGTLVVNIIGNDDNVLSAINYLKENKVEIEVINI